MVKWNLKSGAVIIEGRPPHAENKDVTIAEAKQALANRGGYFCRWTTDFDCGHKTEWWYCLRDTPIELDQFKSKTRNEINRGLRTTSYRLLKADEVKSLLPAMFNVAVESFSEYPAKYRPVLNKNNFSKSIEQYVKSASSHLWGCFDRDTGEMVGYSVCGLIDGVVHLWIVKIRPTFLKNRVNAGLVFTLCKYYLNEQSCHYVCDGQRNIRHETNYQEYLVKTLGFRKAYCKLNIVYSPIMNFVVNALYPFRGLLKSISNNSAILYNIYCVLKQEEYARSFR